MASKKGPTPEQKAQARAYIHRCQRLMELPHWRISIHFCDLKLDLASVDITPNQNLATIKISNQEFWKATRELKRQTVAHELLHCHLAPLEDAYGAVANEEARRALESVLERVTDSIAWVVAKGLPEWGK